MIPWGRGGRLHLDEGDALVDSEESCCGVAEQDRARGSHKLQQGPATARRGRAAAVSNTSKFVCKGVEGWVTIHLNGAAVAHEVGVVERKTASLLNARCDTLKLEAAGGSKRRARYCALSLASGECGPRGNTDDIDE